MEQGAGQRTPRTRAAPGLRPGALRPPARSWLTASRKAARGAKGRLPKSGRLRGPNAGETVPRKRGPAPEKRRDGAQRGPAQPETVA
jgi:hypothetical protein